jgi:hypothetical protein
MIEAFPLDYNEDLTDYWQISVELIQLTFLLWLNGSSLTEQYKTHGSFRNTYKFYQQSLFFCRRL